MRISSLSVFGALAIAGPLVLAAAPEPARLADHAGVEEHVNHGHVAVQPVLTLDGARLVLGAATAEARRLGVAGSYAVVDAGGHLLALERLDGSVAASPDIATAKARSSAMFEKRTSVFETIINDGRTAMVTVPGFVPLQGGVPITIDGHVVGAIGVSGASSAKQDEEFAVVGANAFAAAH